MANVFNSVKGLHPRRNSFSAHTYRNDFTGKLGLNYPVYIQHVTAATRVMCSAHALVRLQALIAPVMDNIDFYLHFWKAPYRLIENDRFTAFFSGEIEASDYNALFATPYEVAQVVANNLQGENKLDNYNLIFGNGSLMDFCGYDVDLFPILSYDEELDEWVLTGGNNWKSFNWRNLIFYYMLHEHWYMNENVPYFADFIDLVNSLVKEQKLASLGKLLAYTVEAFGSSLLPHGWDKDYYTSGLPNVQFGDPVTLPLAGSAPVNIASDVNYLNFNGTGAILPPEGYGGVRVVSEAHGTLVRNAGGVMEVSPVSGTDKAVMNIAGKMEHEIAAIESEDEDGNPVAPFSADLSEASAITINELRFANALQVFKERQMRFGRRRLEFYKGFFDVSPEDLRLQVPAYLGGGRIPINISDVEQTSANEGSQVLGSIAGKGTAVAGGFAGFKTFCSEESIILGMCFAMPHITYSKSVSRFLFKTNDIYDYFNPSFEHLGEQVIENIEIFSGASGEGEFAYTPRYNEYRFHANEMHGQFKDTLAHWTLGRIFDSQPALNADFVYMQPKNFERIFAVSGIDNMLASLIFNVRLVQPVSKYGTPMLLA